MTCKDCIHSGLCYKENDYENFPDRCGNFIPERPQGEWGNWIIAEIQCPTCLRYFEIDYYTKEELKKCSNCGADMRNEESPQAEAVSDRYDEGFRDGYAQCINDKEERKENNRLFQKGGAV